MDLNSGIFTGNITADITVQNSKNNKVQFAHFSLASDRYGRNGKQSTVFIPCTAFGKSAQNLAKYTHKGSKIGVSGYFSENSRTTKHGDKVRSIELIVNNFDFEDGHSNNNSNNSQKSTNNDNASQASSKTKKVNMSDSDMPF